MTPLDATYEYDHMVLVLYVWHILLSVIFSGSIQIIAINVISFFFRVYSTLVCVHTPNFLYLSVDRHLHCLNFLVNMSISACE